MTASRLYGVGDLIGVRVFTDRGDFPDLASEQTVALDALDPHHVSALLCAADAAAFYTRQKPCSGQIGLDAQPHGTRGYAMVAERAC
jgi:hypothetical protein